MIKPKIDTIIFDLGGILVDWKPEYVYRKVFNNDEEKVQWFLNNICTPSWNIEQDGGRLIKDAVALKTKEFPQYKQLIELYYNEWEHMFSGAIAENVTLFKKLKASKNYKIYALTNWSAEKWDKALELFPFFNDFDGVIVSGQEKIRKPHPDIYKLLINRFNIIPENSIFIDDNKDNVTTAESLNIHGIHCPANTNLKKQLGRFNLTF